MKKTIIAGIAGAVVATGLQARRADAGRTLQLLRSERQVRQNHMRCAGLGDHRGECADESA